MIKHDHGTAVAANSARLAVVSLERTGVQAQFIVRPTPASHTDLTPLLHWIESRRTQNLTVSAGAGDDRSARGARGDRGGVLDQRCRFGGIFPGSWGQARWVSTGVWGVV